MKRCIVILLVITAVLPLHAQEARWGVGVTGGTSYNSLSGSPQYAYDLRTTSAWGWNVGLTTQYTINQWLGVRADLLYITKCHDQHRGPMFDTEWGFTQKDGYLQLPLMATFTFGPERLHGFLNTGFSFGWWATKHRQGYELSLSPEEDSEFSAPVKYSQNIPFDSRRDQRVEVAPFAGIGIGWAPISNWEIMAEGRLYYGLTSITKTFQGLKTPRYNTTVTLGVTLMHKF